MTDDGNDLGELIVRELNNGVTCEGGDGERERRSLDTVSDDFPLSLLSYFESSKCRAALCEELILEEPQDEAETDKCRRREQCVEVEALTSKSSTTEDEVEKSSRYDEREQEVMKRREEERKRRQINFQEELKKITEAEKMQQKELELMEKRAKEELELEFQLQQELIRDFQRQVNEEKKKVDAEHRRMQDEHEKKRKEMEEKVKKEEEEERRKQEAEKNKRMEEETREKKKKRKLEEEVRLQEKLRRKEEEQKRRRRREEEERRRVEDEEVKRKEGGEKTEEDETEIMKEDKRRRTSEDVGMKEWREKEKDDAEDKRSEEEQRTTTLDHEVRTKNETRDLQKRENGEKKLREEEEEKERGLVNEEGERKKKEVEEEKRKRGKEEEEMIERKGMGEDVCESMREEEEETKREVEKNEVHEDRRKKRRCEGEETEEMENFREEDRGRNTDGEEKRREEEQRVETEAEVGMKREEVKEDKGEPEENMRKKKEVEKRHREEEEEEGKDDGKEEEKLWREKEQNTEDKEKKQEEVKGQKEKEEQETKTGGGQPEKEKESEKDEKLTLHAQSQSSETSVQQQVSHASSPVRLPEHTEHKRLSWTTECVPWSKLCLQNKNKRGRGRGRGRGSAGGRRRTANGTSERLLSPVCPHAVLVSTGCESLQQVTTVTLEDLPGCSLSTLARCPHLQSLTVRRCGLKSLEGVDHLANLRCIDAQENDISFLDCGNTTSLRVLRLGHNKLTSVHGLSGAENLDVLDLSHNLITRIAGLESARRLQSLSLGHNQLISTRGLRDVSTLLHLDCSHNHLAAVEGLEKNALLHTLDLRANNITEPPSVLNHVLLRELHLDDNSVSSLQGLAVCWLPLMQHLSAAQNRITQLPPMSDFVSLANLDLRFNCISELRDACESVAGCTFLREVQLAGNPLQQESGWRSVLHTAVPGLRAIDGMETDSPLSAPAVPQVSLASGCGGGGGGGSFLAFCQAQLKQTGDLQLRHHRELSNASSPLDAVKRSCRHFTETLHLAVEQRLAHERGDTTVTSAEQTLDTDSKTEQSRDGVIPADTSDTEMSFHSSATNEKTASVHLETAPESDHRELDSKSTAAAVIQQRWRKYREKCGNVGRPPTAEKGVGDGGEPDSVDRSVTEQDYAATAIQAFWRGFALRRRLASALAVVTRPDGGEDEAFEDVDVDGFVFDEAAEEKRWTWTLSEDSSSSGHHHHRVSEPLAPPSPGPSRYATSSIPHWTPKQAWVDGEHGVDATGERTSPESSYRLESAAASALSRGLSAKSERMVEEWGFKDGNTALLMLKRAQKMRSTKKQRQKMHQDPFVCQQGPAETRNRPAPHRRNHMRVSAAEQQAKQMEKVKQERAQQWLRLQESERFLPEIGSDILNGGRVQLVAEPGYSEHQHHTGGLWVGSSSAAQLSKGRNHPRRNSANSRPTGKELPSPQRADSAPVKKERMSFRDSPVQLSGGWGGGKKRGVKGQVHK